MKRQYAYVGPTSILQKVDLSQTGSKVLLGQAVLQWIEKTKQRLLNHQLTTTFIVNLQEELVISDRHSEHVMCAGGYRVLSAGEITFEIANKQTSVIAITNQSTGYCPEPSSWSVVARALQKANLEGPDYFTDAYEFRYCYQCQHINLIKEQVFECAICESMLDINWNLDQKN